MALQYSVAVRNAQLDALESTIGATAKLRILTGSPPASCAAAETGTLLCELTLPADYMAAGATGSKAKSGTWQGTAVATNTAGYFRLVDNAGTTCHVQGTIGAGSGDLSFDSVSVTSGQVITINTFTLTAANA